MADSYTEGLRSKAAHWSLAGDRQLLDVLQGLHQKIIEKCEETNRNLEKMVTVLDEASVHLQNTNNKFTALSNSQFVESRVYDDDIEALTEPDSTKEVQPAQQDSDLVRLKHSLRVLEDMHEAVTIMCDSDSDSGTDEDEDIARVVLKPKDLYADRPLPYIIGTQPWKSKWHVGLVVEESDSDSASLKEVCNKEEYSDSEPESVSASLASLQRHKQRSPTISSSSDLGSSQGSRAPPPPRSQADLAAELARRLGGAQVPTQDVDQNPPSPTVRKVYKPHQPTPGTVFLDEPPPLDLDQSDDTDEDIFAEINKHQPYKQSNRVSSSVADDLFGRPDYSEEPPPMPQAKQNQSLFQEESEPELFATDKPVLEVRTHDTNSKKPIGGMSLFGSNANAESIGAAILKRNQRQSQSSGEESDSESIENNTNKQTQIKNIVREQTPQKTIIEEVKTQKNRERDIFEDLFAKSERINKESKVNIKEEKKEQKKPENKIDLFSDNIFDDIDDIFTTNIKVAPKNDKKGQKSIFDDDDDLFSENKDDNTKHCSSKDNKTIFEREVFSDPPEIKNEPKDTKPFKEAKGLFEDSDDDLFTDVDKTAKNVTLSINVTRSETETKKGVEIIKNANVKKGLFSDDKELLADADKKTSLPFKQNVIEETPKATNAAETKLDITTKPSSMIVKSPDIFDDDDDGLFLFQSKQNQPKPIDSSKNTLLNNKSLLENKTSENQGETTPKTSSPDIAPKKEIVLPKSTEVKDTTFSDEETESSKITKPRTENSAISTNNTKVIDGNKDETKIFSKQDQTIIQTTITTAKPDLSENLITADVIVKTKIKIKSNTETGSAISEDIKTSDTNVIDTTITVMPETTQSVPSSNFEDDDNEAEGIVKPVIARKPVAVKKSIVSEQISSASTTLDNMKEVDANKNVTESIFDDLNTEELEFTNEKQNVTKTDLFSDIFNDQPPVFEKPKEPKKSKNVNALFDDDSDDESLFFKKNDVISDERPEGFVSGEDKLFGLFRDEPPAIDVDFVQKPNKVERLPKSDDNATKKDKNSSTFDQSSVEINKADRSGVTDDIFGNENKSIYGTLKNTNINVSLETTPQSIPDDIDKNNGKEYLFNDITDDIFEKPANKDDYMFDTNVRKKEPEWKGVGKSELENKSIPDDTETKKVGKLKHMNLNINVNTLLPGASPKKVAKSKDNTDGQIPSRSNDELHTTENIVNNEFEPQLTKSVSFDGNANSSVLDNKLSKERAKIQVKRRPSTRRARREAVKKSGIDFGEDSTDNSSSVDDHSKNIDSTKTEKCSAEEETYGKGKHINSPNVEHDRSINHDTPKTSQDIEEPPITDFRENVATKSNISNVFDSDENLSNTNDACTEPETKINQNLENELVIAAESSENTTEIKSKIVYILNDEDIFDTKENQVSVAAESNSEKVKHAKTEKVFDDPEYILPKKVDNEGITTLGQVYKEPKPKTQDFLSESDDDNLFKASKTIKASSVEKKQKTEEYKAVEVKNVPLTSKNKQSTFSDSDDELFKGNSKGKIEDKPSWFGSDSDEDLFSGVKKKKGAKQKVELKKDEIVTRKEIKNTSLFEDDDDDDLFSVKPKRNDLKPETVKPVSAKELTTHQEVVFEDPLSLLGSDDE